MNKRNLNQFKRLHKYPMTAVMAQAWILSTELCRHAVPARGFLRTLVEDQK